jgi:hypothetical protein
MRIALFLTLVLAILAAFSERATAQAAGVRTEQS